MILLSVAHSGAQKGYRNEKFGLSEYPLSQGITKSCAEYLKTNKEEIDVLDVGDMANYRTYKKKYINNLNAEISIEIHLNSGAKKAKYHSCFYYKNSQTAGRLSAIILNNLKTYFEPMGWGTVQSIGVPAPNWPNERYGLILDTKPPVIIVEPLFLSNDEQALWVSEPKSTEILGEIIAKGILQWKLEKLKLVRS